MTGADQNIYIFWQWDDAAKFVVFRWIRELHDYKGHAPNLRLPNNWGDDLALRAWSNHSVRNWDQSFVHRRANYLPHGTANTDGWQRNH